MIMWTIMESVPHQLAIHQNIPTNTHRLVQSGPVCPCIPAKHPVTYFHMVILEHVKGYCILSWALLYNQNPCREACFSLDDDSRANDSLWFSTHNGPCSWCINHASTVLKSSWCKHHVQHWCRVCASPVPSWWHCINADTHPEEDTHTEENVLHHKIALMTKHFQTLWLNNSYNSTFSKSIDFGSTMRKSWFHLDSFETITARWHATFFAQDHANNQTCLNCIMGQECCLVVSS